MKKTSGWIIPLFLCISFWWLHEHYRLRFDRPSENNIWLIDFLCKRVREREKEKKKTRLTNKHRMTVDDDVSICTDNILNSAQPRMSFFLFVSSIFCPEELIFVQVPHDPTSYCIYPTKLGFCVVSCWWRQYKQLWGKNHLSRRCVLVLCLWRLTMTVFSMWWWFRNKLWWVKEILIMNNHELPRNNFFSYRLSCFYGKKEKKVKYWGERKLSFISFRIDSCKQRAYGKKGENEKWWWWWRNINNEVRSLLGVLKNKKLSRYLTTSLRSY
jgi:hypothetical protein